MAPSGRHSMGQVIEYIPDRLYLASYLHPPTRETPFPGNDCSSSKKRGARSTATNTPCYFTVDDTLLYNAFHHDFGPLHIGHLYRFAIRFHDLLGAKENKDRPVVFWSAADPRSRANAACMLACYMVLIQSWPPHLALAPIAQVDPPLMPFRDAGYSQADYGISVQDVVYGVWRAKEERCCDLDNFDLDTYERFERVEHGDFNWITPHFVAFASPQHADADADDDDDKTLSSTAATTLPQPFRNVLEHFAERDVGLVVRLNSPLYSARHFEARGMQHLDMIFDDGTCPPLTTVRRFIRLAHDTIVGKGKAIAVHCKAGLGRTGCLIGAYLIYRHGFTANEAISFMRFMRPGMVVGPQQHWLHLHQGTFREWWVEERVERRLRRELASNNSNNNNNSNGLPSTPVRPPLQKRNTPAARTPLSEVERGANNVQDDCLPAPTPGQPRKGAAAGRCFSSSTEPVVIVDEAGLRSDEDKDELHHLRAVRNHHRRVSPSNNNNNNNGSSASAAAAVAAVAAAVNAVKCSSSSSSAPSSTSPSRRASAQAVLMIDNDASRDVENVGAAALRAVAVAAAAKHHQHHHHSHHHHDPVVAKIRRRPEPSSSSSSSSPLRGVRKASGRVGTVQRKVSGS
ncbi:hypothetical protein CP532_2367 [Ophiocordyceps camponoti-leonardi (nom. inval.)]|nr:hypothetical protein CP532_2367 [Ophiocordyceps camponoti-leonardi (nom. inval.)]